MLQVLAPLARQVRKCSLPRHLWKMGKYNYHKRIHHTASSFSRERAYVRRVVLRKLDFIFPVREHEETLRMRSCIITLCTAAEQSLSCFALQVLILMGFVRCVAWMGADIKRQCHPDCSNWFENRRNGETADCFLSVSMPFVHPRLEKAHLRCSICISLLSSTWVMGGIVSVSRRRRPSAFASGT